MSKKHKSGKRHTHRPKAAAKQAMKESVEKVEDATKDAVTNMAQEVEEAKASLREALDETKDTADGALNTTVAKAKDVVQCDSFKWIALIVVTLIVSWFIHYKMAERNTHSLMEAFGGGFSTVQEVDPEDKKQLGYAIGYAFGEEMKNAIDQGVVNPEEFDMDQLVRAFGDVLNGRKTIMTKEQIQELGEKRYQMQVDTLREDSEKFVMDYAQNMEEVEMTEGGTVYRVLEQGTGTPVKGYKSVNIHYTGEFADGTVFDSSYGSDKPVEMDTASMIKGMQEALELMRVGDKWEMVIPYDQAYGEQGIPNAIPPFAALKFTVEVVSL